MSGRNFNRPTFKTRGRRTESISGSDVPQEFRTIPQAPRPKADQRREAEAALREWMRTHPTKENPPPATGVKPPWEE